MTYHETLNTLEQKDTFENLNDQCTPILQVGDTLYEAGYWLVNGLKSGTYMAAAGGGKVVWGIVNT